jgi:hypothetical protein
MQEIASDRRWKFLCPVEIGSGSPSSFYMNGFFLLVKKVGYALKLDGVVSKACLVCLLETAVCQLGF